MLFIFHLLLQSYIGPESTQAGHRHFISSSEAPKWGAPFLHQSCSTYVGFQPNASCALMADTPSVSSIFTAARIGSSFSALCCLEKNIWLLFIRELSCKLWESVLWEETPLSTGPSQIVMPQIVIPHNGIVKKCSKCGTEMTHSDEHELYLVCLGEAHNIGACLICQHFTLKVQSDRASRQKAVLWLTAQVQSQCSEDTDE